MPKLVEKSILEKRLESYRSITLIQKIAIQPKPSFKSTLIVLAPFAAGALLLPTSLQAQCGQGTAVFNPTGGTYSDGSLDVDGDGSVDFQFDIDGGLFITPVGTMSVGLFSTSYVQALSTNDVITATSPPSGFAGGNYFYLSNSGYFTNTISLAYYIPIKDAANNLGFIRISKDGNGAFTVATASTGVATANGNISAGVCSSLSPLPVEWVSFTAQSTELNEVLLNWSTTSESNNRGFEVQRSSDGINFFKIGWINGEGNSSREVHYKYQDDNVKPNTTYFYRLRQIDFDGAESFSTVQSVRIDQKGLELNVFPTLINTGQELTVELTTNQQNSICTLALFDMEGKQLLKQEEEAVKGRNTFSLSLTGIPVGTYFFKLNDKQEVLYQKLVIQ